MLDYTKIGGLGDISKYGGKFVLGEFPKLIHFSDAKITITRGVHHKSYVLKASSSYQGWIKLNDCVFPLDSGDISDAHSLNIMLTEEDSIDLEKAYIRTKDDAIVPMEITPIPI